MHSLLLALTTIIGSVLGYEYHISNASDFISFAENVNRGTDYSGTTVLLDSELIISGSIESIRGSIVLLTDKDM